MNGLWAGMIIVGVVYAFLTGNIEQVTTAALDSTKDAVALCITMVGIMAFWMGLMEIANKASVIQKLSRLMLPIFKWLFPYIPIGHSAQHHICTNIIANLLGLGWAATPAGLQAMKSLDELKENKQKNYIQKTKVWKKEEASDEMCTLLVINISSLQLIPINIIAYRTQYGSINPTGILGAAIIATMCSTLAGVIFCKVCMKKRYCR